MAILLLLVSLSSHGFERNANDPIKVEADSAKLDEKKGLATYQGNVIITQGPTSLRADTITVTLDEEGLVTIEALGTPAKLSKQATKTSKAITATAKKITYLRKKTTIVLFDAAKLRQGENSFQGNQISYNTTTQVVDAKSSGKKNQPGGRVELIFHPKKPVKKSR